MGVARGMKYKNLEAIECALRVIGSLNERQRLAIDLAIEIINSKGARRKRLIEIYGAISSVPGKAGKSYRLPPKGRDAGLSQSE